MNDFHFTVIQEREGELLQEPLSSVAVDRTRNRQQLSLE